jgi:hypothetical protein
MGIWGEKNPAFVGKTASGNEIEIRCAESEGGTDRDIGKGDSDGS